MSRKSASFVLCILLIFYFCMYFWILNRDYTLYFHELNIDSHQLGSRLIIDTQGCKIPRTPIFPEYYKAKWKVVKMPDCGYESVISTMSEDQIITANPEFVKNQSCCLHEITRVDKIDNGYNERLKNICVKFIIDVQNWEDFIIVNVERTFRANHLLFYNTNLLPYFICDYELSSLSPCEEFTSFMDVNQKDILLTQCGKSLNFDVNFRINPEVQEKLDYWKNSPPSVILFGIDTVSRSHAFRSLPKTLGLMKKMGFVDFKGYHSLEPSTLTNFMGFLMGLPRKEVRSGCAPNWTSPFDICPFIWKDFAREKYITMYVEDGDQTFNWGGQSGFEQRPTDYYIHALFNAIRDLRSENNDVDTVNRDCTSSETVPEFVVRYTERFIRKFRNLPFFSFTWLEDPFHNNQYALRSMDEKIYGLFELLNALPNLLERTLIVFLSDHGDRFSFFRTKSLEGFIERGLPPLFIRFPKTLREMFPDLDNTMLKNTNALTSPFDLHHTLQHILSLLKDTDENITYEPVMTDRSSLFVPVDTNRTCDQLNVLPGNCVCGTSVDVKPIENPYYLTKIIDFAEGHLNKIISSSKYKKLCHHLTASVESILFSQILKTSKEHTDYLVQFLAAPGDAKFEVKIKVRHSASNFDGCELIGEFERVNAYGNQSSCVEFKTDNDKRMKELCVCKTVVKRNYHPY